MRVGRIPYINCYPVYGAIDRGLLPLAGTIVDGIPSTLNRMMADGELDVSVVSAVEYARAASRYLLLPDLAISCDGPVRSVMLFSKRPAPELTGRRVLLTRSSMTSVALLRLLFRHVWRAQPDFAAGDAELRDVERLASEPHDARLVIGDAALLLGAAQSPRSVVHHANGSSEPETPGAERSGAHALPSYPYVYDLGAAWKAWTGLPFVFAVWVARRDAAVGAALAVHAQLIESRDWGLAHVDTLAAQASDATGLPRATCATFLSGLDYRLSYGHLAGLTDFFRRLAADGEVPDGSLAFLPAA
ncbi:MAG TPA: menaquinone biosynthesis protein [Gemmatimonadaceae bacterium]|nr:menaquinone biosynthesis protein [Gemmatimonadaceae bacterium]